MWKLFQHRSLNRLAGRVTCAAKMLQEITLASNLNILVLNLNILVDPYLTIDVTLTSHHYAPQKH